MCTWEQDMLRPQTQSKYHTGMPWQTSRGSGLSLRFPAPNSHTSKDFTWGLHWSPSPVALLIACPHHVPTPQCFTDEKAKNGYHRQGAMIETHHQSSWCALNWQTGLLLARWHEQHRSAPFPWCGACVPSGVPCSGLPPGSTSVLPASHLHTPRTDGAFFFPLSFFTSSPVL